MGASKVDTAAALQKLGGASLIVATVPSANAITPLLKGPWRLEQIVDLIR